MVLVNLYELWCCRTLTQPITILKVTSQSRHLLAGSLFVRCMWSLWSQKDLDSLAYGLSRLRYTEKCAQRINETYPPVGQSVDNLKMITRMSILFLLALRHLWVNLLCTLTRGSRYCEKPEEFNPNRRRESRPFTKIQLLFHWRRNKRLCRRALLRNGQCIGLDPAITLRPNIMNAIRVPLSPASILWAERLWWFSQQYFEFHRCLHS